MHFGKLAIAVALIVFFLSPEAQAHSGGTDAAGCHTDNSNGSYHCHNGGGGGGGGGALDTDALWMTLILTGVVVGAILLITAVTVAVYAGLSKANRKPNKARDSYLLIQKHRFLAFLFPLEE